MLGLLLWAGAAVAAEPTFYELFTRVLATGRGGFLRDASLVDTNNPGPLITNAPIPFFRFVRGGELAGVRLGMTMSEVVAAWGKPWALHSRCMIGPRFYYGPRRQEAVSVFFEEDRLILIGIGPLLSPDLVFDNGLTGRSSRSSFETAMGGPPALGSQQLGMFAGNAVYFGHGLRTDFGFTRGGEDEAPDAAGLDRIAVRSDDRAQKTKTGQNARNNPAPGTAGSNAIPVRLDD